MLSNFFSQFFKNSIFWSAILAWFIAQVIKIIIDVLHHKKLDLKLILSSGGMPSSHSALVTTTSFSIGLVEGFDSPIFAASAVLCLVVMYDAAGVRRAAGKQAAVLNMLVEKLETFGINIDQQLKELLGHSPIEVFFGAILGIVVAIIFHI